VYRVGVITVVNVCSVGVYVVSLWLIGVYVCYPVEDSRTID